MVAANVVTCVGPTLVPALALTRTTLTLVLTSILISSHFNPPDFFVSLVNAVLQASAATVADAGIEGSSTCCIVLVDTLQVGIRRLPYSFS
jgi:hypothetical protein